MKTISLTGATGNMGKETLVQLMDSPVVSKVKILVLPRKKDKATARKWQKMYGVHRRMQSPIYEINSVPILFRKHFVQAP